MDIFEFWSLDLLHVSDLSDEPLLKNIAFYYEYENKGGINKLYDKYHLPLKRKFIKDLKLQNHLFF